MDSLIPVICKTMTYSQKKIYIYTWDLEVYEWGGMDWIDVA